MEGRVCYGGDCTMGVGMSEKDRVDGVEVSHCGHVIRGGGMCPTGI